MSRCVRLSFVSILALAACASSPERRYVRGASQRAARTSRTSRSTAASKQAMQGYRRFLEATPTSRMAPEAMRRLADLQLEKAVRNHRRQRRSWSCRLRSRRSLRRTRSADAAVAKRPHRPPPRNASRTRNSSGARRRCSELAATPSDPGLLELGRPSRGRARWKPSNSTSRCSPNTRPTSATTKCSTRWRARMTSSGGRTRRWASCEHLVADCPIRGTSTRCSSGAANTSSREGSIRDAEKPPMRRSSRWNARSEYYELAFYKLGWTLYKQEFYEEALHRVHGAAGLQGVHRLRLRPEARGRRGTTSRGHVSRHQPELLEPRRPRRASGVLRGKRQPQLRGPDLPQPCRVLPREASLPGRDGSLRLVRRSASAA